MLLRRQVTQLPRWLGQARYNGPPKTHHGLLVALPHDYATNPSVSADGTHVVYEQYRQKLPVALRLGEIAVVSRDLRSGRDTLVSRPAAPRPNEPLDPRSAYNATVSGDGRLVAYESSPGQRELRQALRAHRRAPRRRRARAHDAHRPSAARRGPLAVGLQPAAGRRRAPPRLPGRARRPGRRRSSSATCIPARARWPAPGCRARRAEPSPRSTSRALSADGRFVAFTAVTTRADGGPGRPRRASCCATSSPTPRRP